MKTADVNAEEFVKVVQMLRDTRGSATLWDMAEELGVPEKIIKAKARKLIRQKVIHGCACGCRGDFEVRKHG